MKVLKFSKEQYNALPLFTTDPDERQKRFTAFDRAVFKLFDKAIGIPGPMPPELVAKVEDDVIRTLKEEHPETLREMLAYTDEIEIGVSCRNSRYGSGWWWDRKYTWQKHMHLHCIFSPYNGGISAWTDYQDKTKIHHFR